MTTFYQVQNHIAGNIMVHDIQKDDSVKKAFTHLERHALASTLLHATFLSLTKTRIKILAASILGIIASTAVKFIVDSKRSDPVKQLSRLLEGVSHQDFSALKHDHYGFILHTNSSCCCSQRRLVWAFSDRCWDYHCPAIIHFRVLHLSALLTLDIVCVLSHLHSLIAPTGPDLTFRNNFLIS